MSDMKKFDTKAMVAALANSEVFKSMQTINNNLMGGSGEARYRISLNGGKFRQMLGSEQLAVSKEDNMNVVIVNAAPVSRVYYAGQYDPGNISPPTCWSDDTNVPAGSVPEDQKQANRCASCPQNVKGSGTGETRACRFNQRVAVALEGKLDRVYQLQLPAKSIFGEAKDGKMPMQAYARFLNTHNTPAIAIITNMQFDENSGTPKLFFKAVRPLEEAELQQVLDLKDHPDTLRIVSKIAVDGAQEAALEQPTQKPAAPAVEEDDEEEDTTSAPKKVSKKTPKKASPDGDIQDIIDNWDD